MVSEATQSHRDGKRKRLKGLDRRDTEEVDSAGLKCRFEEERKHSESQV